MKLTLCWSFPIYNIAHTLFYDFDHKCTADGPTKLILRCVHNTCCSDLKLRSWSVIGVQRYHFCVIIWSNNRLKKPYLFNNMKEMLVKFNIIYFALVVIKDQKETFLLKVVVKPWKFDIAFILSYKKTNQKPNSVCVYLTSLLILYLEKAELCG